MSATSESTEIITRSSIVNATLRQYPETTAIFNQFGIDSCCGGAASINDSALRDGADPQALLDALNVVIRQGQANANLTTL